MSHLASFRPHSRSSRKAADVLKPFTSSHSIRSTSTLGSTAPPRSSRGMAGMLDIERARTRRERTFIGSECAVCEEPLEHTLRGERILQLSCGHVSHEACFYEYIREFESQHCPTCNAALGLDTSRGGNVLDLGRFAPFSLPVCWSNAYPSQRSSVPSSDPYSSMNPANSRGRHNLLQLLGTSRRHQQDHEMTVILPADISHHPIPETLDSATAVIAGSDRREWDRPWGQPCLDNI